MSELSPRMSWTYPSRDEDPWWDRFVDFVRSMDASGFAAREDRNVILSGGGTLSWDAGSAGLEWTQPFRFFSPSTGYFTLVAPAVLAPADGEVIRFDIVRHPGMSNQVAAEVAPYAENTDNSMLLGVRYGGYFYFRTGLSIADGTVIAADDFWQGGGGGFSVANTMVDVVGPAVYAASTRQTILCDPTGGAITVNLPPLVGLDGLPIEIINITSDVTPITVAADGVEQIISSFGATATFELNTPNERRYIRASEAHGAWIVTG